MLEAKKQIQRAVRHLYEALNHLNILDNDYGEVDYYLHQLEAMSEGMSEDGSSKDE